jgi:hypothetical protein
MRRASTAASPESICPMPASLMRHWPVARRQLMYCRYI